MNKETFVSKKEDLENRIQNLRTELKELESEYIEKCKKTSIGTRIKETRYGIIGFVTGHRITYNHNIIEVCVKEKKDGTASKHSMYVYSHDDVELAPKQ